jgi:PII-like signaling protein
LRIYIGGSDKHGHRSLYEVIVEEARRRGMAGATVFQGVMGFGKTSRIHTAKILRLSEDLPFVVEIVDTPERIEAFLPDLDKLMGGGMVTVERVRVITYRHGPLPETLPVADSKRPTHPESGSSADTGRAERCDAGRHGSDST